MRLALAQMNAVVGDLDGNRAKILDRLADASDAGADLVVYPELAVTGYPPEDLLLRPGFVHAAHKSLEEIAQATTGIVALVGTPWFDRDLANACAVCADGRVQGIYRKHFLPNYGVFDEHRYFAEGRDLLLLRMGDVYLGPTVCEDLWQPGPPATDLALAGAQLVVNLSASPFHVGKAEEREEMLVTRARDTTSYVAFCNLVGGQDELVFDGHSVVLDDAGEVIARAPGFEEHLLLVDVEPDLAIGRRLRDVRRRELDRSRERVPEVEVLELEAPAPADGGVDRQGGRVRAGARADASRARTRTPRLRREERFCGCRGRGFGRDRLCRDSSALRRRLRAGTGPLRVDALAVLFGGHASRRRAPGREPRLRLPGDRHRGRGRIAPRGPSRTDARARGLAAENLQARVRGVLLMALSNTFGWLVVSTGNKSELAVGYSTLYGDMVGGFALLKDVFKTDVFRLAPHLNERSGRDLIPSSTIERAPSAELRPDQRDDDSIPPYDVLDPVLEATSSSTARTRSCSTSSTPGSWSRSSLSSIARSTSGGKRLLA